MSAGESRALKGWVRLQVTSARTDHGDADWPAAFLLDPSDRLCAIGDIRDQELCHLARASKGECRPNPLR
jgi:hypothetical protein